MNYDMQLYELHDICIKKRYTYCWMIDTGKKNNNFYCKEDRQQNNNSNNNQGRVER